MNLNPSLVEQACSHLQGRIRKTPCEASPRLSRLRGAPVWLKLENLQLTGSFKIRGAIFKLSRLGAAEKRDGVVTCSAGNHGKAVAYASKDLGIPARIYVPATVDEAKYRGMKELGAEVIRTEHQGYDACDRFAVQEAQRLQKPFISPFDDWEVMAANGGSLAREVLAQSPGAEEFLLPVGGGGLAAGFSFEVKRLRPQARIIGCQAALSPALRLSLERGRALTSLDGADTLAGGLEGGIGEMSFSVLKDRVDDTVLVSEEEFARAVIWMLDHHQYLIEPSAGAPVAACLAQGRRNHAAVLVLSGRNVALGTLRRIMGRAGE